MLLVKVGIGFSCCYLIYNIWKETPFKLKEWISSLVLLSTGLSMLLVIKFLSKTEFLEQKHLQSSSVILTFTLTYLLFNHGAYVIFVHFFRSKRVESLLKQGFMKAFKIFSLIYCVAFGFIVLLFILTDQF